MILAKILPASLILVGLVFILNASWPILSYEIFASGRFKSIELLSPVSVKVQGVSTERTDPTNSPYNNGLTNANDWFLGKPELKEVSSKVKYYNLSIPKLNIKDAVVEIGGDDLSKHLIHYKGTALPGREGNAVVFGHSALPQFYSTTSYLTIFTKLPSLRAGDEVVLNYDGISYKYKIEKMVEVGPTDIQVLEQRYDNSYLTLVTCVPPGTYLRRLVIRAKIVPPGQI